MVSKKQKEKRKDFQKTKLRVGKTKANATSHTDTSFVAKSISLPSQSIAKTDSTDEETFERYLALLKHHSSTTRKEALVFIQSNLHGHENHIKPVFSAAAPLILDTSKSVREAVLELFKADILQQNMSSHAPFIMLYVHSAMTHITPEIRAQSTDFLNILLDSVPEQIVRLSWAKTLKCFFPLLGWPLEENIKLMANASNTSTGALSSSSVTTGLAFGSSATKTKLAHIISLDKLLSIGLDEDLDSSLDNLPPFHHPDTARFLLPSRSGPYATLGIFSRNTTTTSTSTPVSTPTPSASNKNSRSSTPNPVSSTPLVTEDVESRCGLIRTVYFTSLTHGLENTVKEAGQVGRIASNMLKFLNQRISTM